MRTYVYVDGFNLYYGALPGGIVRINIDLDDKLAKEAMQLANVRTIREAVAVALQRFVQSGRQRKLLNLYGTGGIRRDYGHKRARSAS